MQVAQTQAAQIQAEGHLPTLPGLPVTQKDPVCRNDGCSRKSGGQRRNTEERPTTFARRGVPNAFPVNRRNFAAPGASGRYGT